MNKTLLVSLVSDQTIPNVQMIKQLNGFVNQFLFISTEAMEKSGQRNWIINANKLLPENVMEPVIVDQFSFTSMEEHLDKIDFSDFDKIYVNLTGGTKVMTLAAFEFFKEVGAEIYYLTGRENERIKLSPGRRKIVDKINVKVTLSEYLTAYGFDIVETKGSGIEADFTDKFFELYTANLSQLPNHPMINLLRDKYRDKGLIIASLEGLNEFLSQIEFPVHAAKLTKYEVKYLTGEWFEEWVQNKLKAENIIDPGNLKSGIVLSKNSKEGEMVPNEMDVLFIHSNTLYTIECKTSVFHRIYLSSVTPKETDGKIEDKIEERDSAVVSIIGDVIYKSDSLQKSFGLFANTNIFLLNSKSEKKVISISQRDRAKLSKIKIFYLEDLIHCKSITELLGIK